MRRIATTFERKMLREPSVRAALALVALLSFGLGMLIGEWLLPALGSVAGL